jgi:hypothetical protein
MTTREEWLALANQVEQSLSYSLALDAAIYAAKCVEDSEITYDARPGKTLGTVICYYDDGRKKTHGTATAPEFTRKVGVASTFQEKETRVCVERHFGSDGHQIWSCVLHWDTDEGVSAVAATEALARLAAGLRLRAARMGQ